MLAAPAKWPIRVIAILPDALRPGLFLALVMLLLWFVLARRGLRGFWHSLCRGTAYVVGAVVGLALLPEYAMTSARRRRGEPPSRFALLMAGPSEAMLSGAAALYQRHEHQSGKAMRPPWKLAGLIVIASAAAWLIMHGLDRREPARRQLAEVYEHWRDIEAWAGVSPDSRAAAGVMGAFRVGRVGRDGLSVRVRLRCPGISACAGDLIARNTYGAQLASMPVAFDAGERRTVLLTLSSASAGYVRGLHAVVDQK